MKLLLTADLHVYAHKKSSERLQHCLDVVEWIFKTAVEKKVDHVVIAGDLFHDRYKIDVPTYQRCFEIFQNYDSSHGHKLRVVLLVGNHDMWFHQKWDFSSIIPFSGLPNVTVINKPCVTDIGGQNIAFLPFTSDPVTALNLIEQNYPPADILVGHVAINDADLNPFAMTRSEVMVENDGDMIPVDAKIFAKYKQVFLGHYHAPQIIGGNVEYLGSPLQLNFGDAFQKKHILIYHVEADFREYVVNDFSPKHFIIRLAEANDYPLRDNFVKLITDVGQTLDVVDVRKQFIEQHGSKTFEVKPPKKNESEEETLIDNAKSLLADEFEITRRFIEQSDKAGRLGDLKADKLIQMASQIIKETNEEIKD